MTEEKPTPLPVLAEKVPSDNEIKETLEHKEIFFSDEDDEEWSPEATKQLFKTMDRAIRPPPTGAEHLIANELALAVVSQSIEKIRHICEAFMILEKEDVAGIGMAEQEAEVMRVYAMTQALVKVREEFDYDEYANPREMIKIGLPFTEEEAYAYLHPWATRLPFESFPSEGRLSSLQIEELIMRYDRLFAEAVYIAKKTRTVDPEVVKEMAIFKAKYLYWTFRDGLTYETFNAFYTAFLAETTPKAMQWFKKIMGKISPSSFREALASFGGKIPK